MRSKTSKHSQTPFCIHHFRSNIISCNEKFYTIFMNFKTKFKIFSLKSPPSQKIKAKQDQKPAYDKELKFFPWIR
ncbi:hypothetical protein D8X81_05725 [Helicobacter pylori]|nr:hypothetical protein D8X81_05725 [Helicobacter pylori]